MFTIKLDTIVLFTKIKAVSIRFCVEKMVFGIVTAEQNT